MGPVVETNTTSKPDKSADHENALGRARTFCAIALATGSSDVPVSISELIKKLIGSQKHVMVSTQKSILRQAISSFGEFEF